MRAIFPLIDVFESNYHKRCRERTKFSEICCCCHIQRKMSSVRLKENLKNCGASRVDFLVDAATDKPNSSTATHQSYRDSPITSRSLIYQEEDAPIQQRRLVAYPSRSHVSLIYSLEQYLQAPNSHRSRCRGRRCLRIILRLQL
jgi:hypothetical protein